MANNDAESFTSFFQSWMNRQNDFREELLNTISSYASDRPESMTQDELTSRDQRITDLLSRVRLHYLEYFETKGRLIEADVYTILSSTWLTSYERVTLWVGGFKPGLVFRVVPRAELELTPDQETRIEAVLEEIMADEIWLTEEHSRIQREAPSIVAPYVTEAAQSGRIGTEGERVMNSLKSAFATLVACADRVRVKATTKVIAILNPIQTVKFYVAMATHQVRMRELGLGMMGMGMGSG
ncbi:protein ZW2-like [Impatiens glandulifera]|uniref:protein ZW2-like n=1 Tax=Impatiens glandulifera TaxID=253017 RepID=UPI001FB05202|nr:protein ZW2-like [Impatiens glandulifera]